jgi:hypothetical protein
MLWRSPRRDDADRRLHRLLLVLDLRRGFAAEARGLLCVLFPWLDAVSTHTDGALETVNPKM